MPDRPPPLDYHRHLPPEVPLWRTRRQVALAVVSCVVTLVSLAVVLFGICVFAIVVADRL